jgi:hypothetical protein
MINQLNDKIEKILIGAGISYSLSNLQQCKPVSAYYDEMCKTQKFQYAGLSKRSPSHAQQQRDSKKAKNRGRR